MKSDNLPSPVGKLIPVKGSMDVAFGATSPENRSDCFIATTCWVTRWSPWERSHNFCTPQSCKIYKKCKHIFYKLLYLLVSRIYFLRFTIGKGKVNTLSGTYSTCSFTSSQEFQYREIPATTYIMSVWFGWVRFGET